MGGARPGHIEITSMSVGGGVGGALSFYGACRIERRFPLY